MRSLWPIIIILSAKLLLFLCRLYALSANISIFSSTNILTNNIFSLTLMLFLPSDKIRRFLNPFRLAIFSIQLVERDSCSHEPAKYAKEASIFSIGGIYNKYGWWKQLFRFVNLNADCRNCNRIRWGNENTSRYSQCVRGSKRISNLRLHVMFESVKWKTTLQTYPRYYSI